MQFCIFAITLPAMIESQCRKIHSACRPCSRMPTNIFHSNMTFYGNLCILVWYLPNNDDQKCSDTNGMQVLIFTECFGIGTCEGHSHSWHCNLNLKISATIHDHCSLSRWLRYTNYYAGQVKCSPLLLVDRYMVTCFVHTAIHIENMIIHE